MTMREFAREDQEMATYEWQLRTESQLSLKIRWMHHVQWPIMLTIAVAGYYRNLWLSAVLMNSDQDGLHNKVRMLLVANSGWSLLWTFRHVINHLLPQIIDMALPAERVFS